MRCLLLWTHLSLLLVLIFGSADLTALGSCPSHCGRISIPYPFGIGKGCYLNEWFEIQCKNSTSRELVPYLPKINNEVVEIILPDPLQNNVYSPSSGYGLLRIKTNITSMGCSNSSDDGIMLGEPLNFTGTPFTVDRYNMLLAVGCNNRATLTNLEPRFAGCISTCDPSNKGDNSWCNGYRCCQIDMPDATIDVIGVSMGDTSTSTTKGRGCRVAFLTEQNFQYNTKGKLTDPQWLYNRQYVIVQLQWVIPKMNISYIESLGYHQREGYMENSSKKSRHFICYSQYTGGNLSGISCTCTEGYSSNPYTLGGCKDIDECQQYSFRGYVCPLGENCVNTYGSYDCEKNKNLTIIIGFSVGFGVLIFIGVSFWLYKFIKRRRKINRKKKLFKRNGGLLLQQQLTSSEGSIEKTIVFNSKELEKATENFSLNRVLGHGGQGTVYKGMLVDGRIVAVKKSKLVDEDKLDEFINEVVILMQINHRNIVKLLGCCLETQVPLLVYEFIPNGNLFEHLHEESDDNTVATWEVRLRIAIDIAGALSYLHSAAWAPIYHRDIKSTNIMLDEKYRAKVADFGTSRSVTVDHTHLTTVVSGTIGYLDPEYFQSSQFTDKSDVYSFGVVLVELITREKPVSFLRSQENRSLATYFILAVKENRLVDIIDPQIRNDCKLEQVMAAAQLAKRCLNLNGKKRPNMREVSMELERIRSPTGDSQSHVQNVGSNIEEEEVVELDIGVESCNNVSASVPYLDAEPLFPRQTWCNAYSFFFLQHFFFCLGLLVF